MKSKMNNNTNGLNLFEKGHLGNPAIFTKTLGLFCTGSLLLLSCQADEGSSPENAPTDILVTTPIRLTSNHEIGDKVGRINVTDDDGVKSVELRTEGLAAKKDPEGKAGEYTIQLGAEAQKLINDIGKVIRVQVVDELGNVETLTLPIEATKEIGFKADSVSVAFPETAEADKADFEPTMVAADLRAGLLKNIGQWTDDMCFHLDDDLKSSFEVRRGYQLWNIRPLDHEKSAEKMQKGTVTLFDGAAELGTADLKLYTKNEPEKIGDILVGGVDVGDRIDNGNSKYNAEYLKYKKLCEVGGLKQIFGITLLKGIVRDLEAIDNRFSLRYTEDVSGGYRVQYKGKDLTNIEQPNLDKICRVLHDIAGEQGGFGGATDQFFNLEVFPSRYEVVVEIWEKLYKREITVEEAVGAAAVEFARREKFLQE